MKPLPGSKWLFITAAAILFAACNLGNNSSTTSGGGVASGGQGGGFSSTGTAGATGASLQGNWTAYWSATIGSGACASRPVIEASQGAITVAASGAFSVGPLSGAVNLANGTVTATLSGPAGCGSDTATGVCGNANSCSGTFSGGGFGTWRFSR